MTKEAGINLTQGQMKLRKILKSSDLRKWAFWILILVLSFLTIYRALHKNI